MRECAGIGTNNWRTPQQVARGTLGLSILLLLVVLLVGCPKKPEVGQAGPAAVGPAAAVSTPVPSAAAAKTPETPVSRPAPPRESAAAPRPTAGAGPGTTGAAGESPLKDIFFDFDKATIRDDQKTALAADVAWLKTNPAAKVVVEGHCDERGTAEYNLALGERRARSVRDFLVAAGIGANRIRTVSYGKERPFIIGHDESAWRFNRRAHFARE